MTAHLIRTVFAGEQIYDIGTPATKKLREMIGDEHWSDSSDSPAADPGLDPDKPKELNDLTVDELKEQLEGAGLAKTGNKAELVARLREAVDGGGSSDGLGDLSDEELVARLEAADLDVTGDRAAHLERLRAVDGGE